MTIDIFGIGRVEQKKQKKISKIILQHTNKYVPLRHESE